MVKVHPGPMRALIVSARCATRNWLDAEHIVNYVPFPFKIQERKMVRAVVEEAAALASLSLFLGMIAIWAQVIASL